MKTIIITGAQGIVGTVLQKGLSAEYKLTLLDKKNCDLTNYNACLNHIAENTDVALHLAWDPKPIYENGTFSDTNFLMTHNIFAAAVAKRVKRVILASSVHTNEYHSGSMPALSQRNNNNVIAIPSMPREKQSQDGIAASSTTPRNDKLVDTPTSIYGSTKLYFEALGRYYALHHNLEVVAIRFGGINPQNSPTAINEPDYEKIFLSHDDLLTFVKKAIEKKELENNYECIYATSSAI